MPGRIDGARAHRGAAAVAKDAKIARDLAPEAREKLRGTSVADNKRARRTSLRAGREVDE